MTTDRRRAEVESSPTEAAKEAHILRMEFCLWFDETDGFDPDWRREVGGRIYPFELGRRFVADDGTAVLDAMAAAGAPPAMARQFRREHPELF